MKLDADDVNAIAARVVKLLLRQPEPAEPYMDAATLARSLTTSTSPTSPERYSTVERDGWR
jgi:hypothetical protein